MSHLVWGISIFLVTLLFIIWRPKGIHEAIPAVLGGLLTLFLGLITLGDVFIVIKIIWNAIFSLIAIMIISAILDEAGFFRWCAFSLAKRTGGSGRLLFFFVILLGVGTTFFFNNDGTILILTPIVYELTKALGFSKKNTFPYLMACGFIADTASLPLVVSNLTNIVTADFFNIDFLRHISIMFLPGVMIIIASFIVLYMFFRGEIPEWYDPAKVGEVEVADPWLIRFGLVVLGCIIVGYLFNAFYSIPVSLIAGAGGLLLFFAAMKRGTVDTYGIVLRAPWHIIFFALGMYMIVYSLRNAGLIIAISQLLAKFISYGIYKAIFLTGTTFALISSLMNNLPSVMTGAMSVAELNLSGILREAMIATNVIGNDIGPKMTPMGSLATLLWLHMLKERGFKFSYLDYLRVGPVLTVPVLLSALLGLVLRVRILG